MMWGALLPGLYILSACVGSLMQAIDRPARSKWTSVAFDVVLLAILAILATAIGGA